MPVTYDNSQPGGEENKALKKHLWAHLPYFPPRPYLLLSLRLLSLLLLFSMSLSPAPSLYAGLYICNRPKSQQRDAGGLYAVKSNKVKVIITLWEITLFVDRRRANYWVPKGLSEIIWANSNNFYLKVEAQTPSLCRVWSIQTIWHGPSFRS